MSSPGNRIPGCRDYETIDECTNFEELLNRQTRSGYDFNRAGLLADHPVREVESAAVRPPNQQVASSVVLILANYKDSLPSQGMEGVTDHNFERQTPGIMTPLLMAAPKAGPSSPH
jgi:hypothetical protein